VLLAVAVVAAGCGTSARDAPPIALPENAEPSAIYDANGTLITVLAEENRQNVALEQVPRTLQDAVVAIEDARFWTHNGVDPRAVARAAGANAAAGGVAEGGSTITQQYVKNALLTPEQTLGRKVEEATTALALERSYSKQLILELYLNTIYLGNGAYGVAAAAQEYFGVPVEELTLEQSALIAGVIQAPSRHDPRTDPEAAVERRNLVLERMREQQLITRAQEERAAAQPLVLAPESPNPTLQRYAAPHFVDEVKAWLLNSSDALGESTGERREALLRGGLRIDTTIDLGLQAKAEEAIRDVLPGQGTDARTPDAALVSIDPRSGHVKAMVGGYDYFGTHSYRQTNLAAGAGRQTGSAFKPIVMAAALENGVSPTKLFDAPSSAVLQIPGGIWRVKGGGIGAGTMAECTVVSSNTCYANIMLDDAVGPERSVEMAQKLGVVSTEVNPNPAIVLGANNATVQDMASVYATFANDGVRVPPVVVTKITGPDGEVIYQHAHSQTRAMASDNVRQIAPALEGVIQRGTGRSAGIGRPAGGKTGSAQNNTDAWFCGYTQQLSTAVWVGFAEPRANSSGQRQLVGMSPPNTRITVYGGTYPAQIWANFMRAALEDVEPTPLMDPATTPVAPTTLPEPNREFVEPVQADEEVTVPEVAGLDSSTAADRLERAGLSSERVVVTSASAQPGAVLTQSPAAGSSVPRGSTVWIEVTALPTTTTASTTTTSTPASTTTTTTTPRRPGRG
jgi:penicillin-binding protein 1A